MGKKYWLYKRGKTFYSFDSETSKRESLYTADKDEAARIIHAKNDATRQSGINLTIAKAYLAGTDPKLVERTWGFGHAGVLFPRKGNHPTAQPTGDSRQAI